MKNIFMENQKEITFEEYMAYKKDGRENLGNNLPVAVYRMLEYALRNTLIEEYGKDSRVPIMKLRENEDSDVREIAEFVYQNVEGMIINAS